MTSNKQPNNTGEIFICHNLLFFCSSAIMIIYFSFGAFPRLKSVCLEYRKISYLRCVRGYCLITKMNTLTPFPSDLVNLIFHDYPYSFLGVNSHYNSSARLIAAETAKKYSFDILMTQRADLFVLEQSIHSDLPDQSKVKHDTSTSYKRHINIRTLRSLDITYLRFVYKHMYSIVIFEEFGMMDYSTLIEVFARAMDLQEYAFCDMMICRHPSLLQDLFDCDPDIKYLKSVISKYEKEVQRLQIVPRSVEIFEALQEINYDFGRRSTLWNYSRRLNDVFHAILRWRGRKGERVRVPNGIRITREKLQILKDERKDVDFTNHVHIIDIIFDN